MYKMLNIANGNIKLLNGMMMVNLNFDNDIFSTQEVKVLDNDGKKRAFMFKSDTYN